MTNLRDFVVVGRDELTGERRIEGEYRLADSEADFWQEPVGRIAHRHADSFTEFLSIFMRRHAPITEPADLADVLAYYARLARQRILDIPSEDLASLRGALEGLLGIQFQTEEAEKLFFRSSLVQTLFYGLFSAWVLWAENAPPDQLYDWRTTAYYLQVPVVEALFHEFSRPQRLRALQLTDLLAQAGTALNRVDRAAFLQRFHHGQAVTYFYEPFLAAFDPELRDQMGVWYTPPEIVQYQVERVHMLLHSELGIADGLADENVVVLDPCAGTGSYLLAVADRIHRTLLERGEGGQAAILTRQALLQRVFGFELLTAPFVIAHLQLGQFLASMGLALEGEERLPIYLTNALTGWEMQDAELQAALESIRQRFPGLAGELTEAERVKREAPIMVVLGNPPYNAYAGVGEAEEADLVEPYKQGLGTPVSEGGWGIRKYNLDDLYVRFFRLAERQIAESGRVARGIVSYISNNSFLDGASYTVMRSHLLQRFQRIVIDNLHGNRRISERTPSGNTCETVFHMGPATPGIRVGTSITTLLRAREAECSGCLVAYRDVWGGAEMTGRAEDKRQQLVDTPMSAVPGDLYDVVMPDPSTRYAFLPGSQVDDYSSWPLLPDLASAKPENGLMEKRGFALIDMDRDALERRMRAYYDLTVPDDDVAQMHPGLLRKAAAFDPVAVRRALYQASKYVPGRLRCYAFKPLDHRWAYVEPIGGLWNRSRPSLLSQSWEGNCFVLSRPKGVRQPEGAPMYFSATLGDNDLLTGHAYYLPMALRSASVLQQSDEADGPVSPNLSAKARAYLDRLGLDADDPDVACWVWWHVLAIGYSLAYQEEQAGGLRLDWPRIPMPEDADALCAGAELGRRVAALLNPLVEVPGVTVGGIAPLLTRVAFLSEPYASEEERRVTVSYTGTGKLISRVRAPEETDAVHAEAVERAMSEESLDALLGGPETLDVVWNTQAANVPRWRNVPPAAWRYVIGGYPVLKKWLSYRYAPALGRSLSHSELRGFRSLARRVTALVLMGPELDAHYRCACQLAAAW